MRGNAMTQQGRRTSVEGTYVGLKRRGKSPKKLAMVLSGSKLRSERHVETDYERLKWILGDTLSELQARDVLVWKGEFLAL